MSKGNPAKLMHLGLTRSILESAIRVQDSLGVGLEGRSYRLCLAHDLRRKGHRVQADLDLDLAFEGLKVPGACRLDLVVDDTVVVATQAVEALSRLHQVQLLTGLRLSGKEVGLLLNFWAHPLKGGGIQRLVRARRPPP